MWLYTKKPRNVKLRGFVLGEESALVEAAPCIARHLESVALFSGPGREQEDPILRRDRRDVLDGMAVPGDASEGDRLDRRPTQCVEVVARLWRKEKLATALLHGHCHTRDNVRPVFREAVGRRVGRSRG